MILDEDNIRILEQEGWIVECESPLEISHEDGSFATGRIADQIITEVIENNSTKG